MQRKLLLLLIPIAMLFMSIVFIFSGLASKQVPTQQSIPSFLSPSPSSSTTAISSQDTELFFDPSQLTIDPSSPSSHSSSIVVRSGNNRITAVQLEMTFDPELVTDITLEPASESTSFFDPSSPVLFNKTDYANGRISYAVGISPNKAAKTGTGVLVHLTFKLKPNTASSSSQITFLGKTMVTEAGSTGSVLKNTSPLTILLTTQP